MSLEHEEQQKTTYELKEQLRSLEADRVCINEQIKILEAKLVIQELRDRIKLAVEENNRLRVKKRDLEQKLELQQRSSIVNNQRQASSDQGQPSQIFF
jgi:predicted nuclease with TOPRIM domain